ncbi:hypothetical protein LZT27_12685 [Aeromonas veronii]|uniref:hypothetical protein n=1 Tax=Aeromonas veronii TaxID=654 RepID=UPI002363AF27|nr:hypothetical protein [Aeromonas veronii]MDD1845444.1 hypothetical protein [Aeromonas veronii]
MPNIASHNEAFIIGNVTFKLNLPTERMGWALLPFSPSQNIPHILHTEEPTYLGQERIDQNANGNDKQRAHKQKTELCSDPGDAGADEQDCNDRTNYLVPAAQAFQ